MSLSMILPLTIGANGIISYTDAQTTEAIRQNLKMILLTNPGEYAMAPTFGVGLKRYLFEPGGESVAETIKSEIFKQCGMWMPYIDITDIIVDFANIDYNSINIKIRFSVTNSVADEYFELITHI